MDRPNILWLFSDQHSAHTMSCAGDPNIETPNLDRLAREGTRFANAYSNTPICSPFRACLYTGQYATTHGVTSLHRPLLPRQAVLAEVLQDAGYHTSHMGKWHLGGGAAPSHFVSPYYRPGWDEWAGWENSNEPFATEYAVGTHPQPLRRMTGYQTDELTDWTVKWLKKRPSGPPWFHVVSIEPPHGPNVAPEADMAHFAEKTLAQRPNVVADDAAAEARLLKTQRGYYAQIKNLDTNVGRILSALEETGQLDSTLIWYFSDHGDMLGSHGHFQKCLPFEESASIPLLVRLPGVVPAGRVAETVVSSVDFMPTLLGLIGIAIPGSCQGTDRSRAVQGREEAAASQALVQFESAFFPDTPDAVFRMLRRGSWVYVSYLTKQRRLLYNLADDPYQMNNLAGQTALAVAEAEMANALAAALSAIGDNFLERQAIMEAEARFVPAPASERGYRLQA